MHALGATVRLADGTLAAADPLDVDAHRATYVASARERGELAVVVDRSGARTIVRLAGAARTTLALEPAPSEPPPKPFVDAAFEARVAAYLKATQEWAPTDRPEPAERHFIRKRRRASEFEARSHDA